MSNNDVYKIRQAKLQQLPVDWVVLVPSASLRYFTGMVSHLSERPLLVFFGEKDGESKVAAIVPQLETPELCAHIPQLESEYIFAWTDEKGYEDAFAQAATVLNLEQSSLGVDGMTMRVTEHMALQKVAPNLKTQPIEQDLYRIRAIKDDSELAAIRKAVAVSEQALQSLLPHLEVGMTDHDITARLEQCLKDAGSMGLAFSTLVQLGFDSAFPHGGQKGTKLEPNMSILIDFGGKVSGYPADITRTFFFGDMPDEKFLEIYKVVKQANAAAIAKSGAGVAMGEVDMAARAIIADSGYGAYFTHRTGHGMGLDVHEAIPQIAKGVAMKLEPGMVFTIEPGIYLPNVGGVRLEDDIYIKPDGTAEVLTSFPKTWQLS